MGQALGCNIQAKQSTVVVRKRFGKFDKVFEPACHYLPRRLGYGVQQLKVKFEIKTKDNVSVLVVASISEKAPDALYKLTDTRLQILSYVVDAVRASVSKLDLGAVFEHKKCKAKAAGEGLEKAFSAYRFEIDQTLVADIQKAMNASNAGGRLWLVTEQKTLALSSDVPGTTSKDVTSMAVIVSLHYDTSAFVRA